jgi:Uma2 family endonuclease
MNQPPTTPPITPPRPSLPDWFPERLLTAADLAALPDELPSGPVVYELDNGRLIIMAPPGGRHGSVENKFAGAFLYEGEKRGHGRAYCGEVGIVLWQNPDRVVGADAVFITNKSLPARLSPEGYLLTIPELAVEVLGKNDSFLSILAKVHDYLKAGVIEVWVANPATRTVRSYRQGKDFVEYTENDTLTVEDLIPDFSLSVRDVFQD